jgi:hypothetical protein
MSHGPGVSTLIGWMHDHGRIGYPSWAFERHVVTPELIALHPSNLCRERACMSLRSLAASAIRPIIRELRQCHT